MSKLFWNASEFLSFNLGHPMPNSKVGHLNPTQQCLVVKLVLRLRMASPKSLQISINSPEVIKKGYREHFDGCQMGGVWEDG